MNATDCSTADSHNHESFPADERGAAMSIEVVGIIAVGVRHSHGPAEGGFLGPMPLWICTRDHLAMLINGEPFDSSHDSVVEDGDPSGDGSSGWPFGNDEPDDHEAPGNGSDHSADGGDDPGDAGDGSTGGGDAGGDGSGGGGDDSAGRGQNEKGGGGDAGGNEKDNGSSDEKSEPVIAPEGPTVLAENVSSMAFERASVHLSGFFKATGVVYGQNLDFSAVDHLIVNAHGEDPKPNEPPKGQGVKFEGEYRTPSWFSAYLDSIGYQGNRITLAVCSAGVVFPNGHSFAQDLADLRGIDVIAYAHPIRIVPNGGNPIVRGRWPEDSWWPIKPPDRRIFRPGGPAEGVPYKD